MNKNNVLAVVMVLSSASVFAMDAEVKATPSVSTTATTTVATPKTGGFVNTLKGYATSAKDSVTTGFSAVVNAPVNYLGSWDKIKANKIKAVATAAGVVAVAYGTYQVAKKVYNKLTAKAA